MIIGEGISDTDIRMPKDAYEKSKDTSTFDVYLIAIVRDSEGRVIDIHKQRSHSPTSNFINIILPSQYANQVCAHEWSNCFVNTGGSQLCQCDGVGGGNRIIAYPNSNANHATYLVGIQVGSGQQSNPYSSYSLAEPIANGSGAGELIYGSPSASSSITVSGNSAYFTISQTFNNNSGGEIPITEVGIITYYQFIEYNNGALENWGDLLVWYDVLSSAISVPNDGSVTIYYTFTVNP
jgi:hypothetical protein